jgi:hypothetical protein
MVVQLLTTQIPLFWEAIKTAVVKADEVPEKETSGYLVEMLLDLLSSKTQCFVRQDEAFNIQSILVSRMLVNRVTGKATAEIQCLYSFVEIKTERWVNEFDVVKKYYTGLGCQSIEFLSKNPRVWQLAKQIGFAEAARKYRIEVS